MVYSKTAKYSDEEYAEIVSDKDEDTSTVT